MIPEGRLAGKADHYQGPAGRQMLAEVSESVGERQMVDGGDAGDDVVRAGRYPRGRVRDGEGHRSGRDGQFTGPGHDVRVRVDSVHRLRPCRQEPGEFSAAGADVQGAVASAGELPQNPPVVVGVVVPGMGGVEAFESVEDSVQQLRHALIPSDRYSDRLVSGAH